MGLGIIYDNVVPVHEGVYGGNYTLVSEVEQEGILLLLEIGEFPLELLVEGSVAGHHAASHRVCEPPFRRCFRVGLPYFRMIGKPEIIVETPAEDFFPAEFHVRSDFPFEFRVHVISESFLSVLSERTARVSRNSVKNIHN